MSNLKAFLKFRLRYTTGLGQLRFLLQSGSGGVAKFVLALLLALFLLTILGGAYILLAVVIQWAAIEQEMPDLMLTILLSVTQVFLFVTSLFSTFNMMFGGNDKEFMASLPVKGKHIFWINLFLAYLTELTTAALMILPLLIIYGIFNGLSVGLWIYGILGIFLFPVFPLCLASVLMLLILMTTGRFRHKELLITLAGFLMLTAVFLLNMYLNSASFSEAMENGAIENLLQSRAQTFRNLSYCLPGAGLLTGALSMNGLTGFWHFLGLIALALIPGVICFRLGGRCYFTVLQRIGYSTVSRKKKLSHKDFHTAGPVKAMFLKEWKLILRSPVYAVNGLSNLIIGPILVAFLFLSNRGTEERMEFLIPVLERHPAAGVATITGLIIFIGGMGMMCSTTISREGPAFWICKTVPVTVKSQMKGRLLAGYSMYLICAVLMLTVFNIALSLPFLHMLAAILLSLAAGPGLVALQMLPDIVKPKLTWNQEKEAMKQNVNGMLAMLWALLFSLLIVVPLMLAGLSLIPALIGYAVAFLICLGVGIGGVIGMLGMAERKFARTW